MQFRQFVPATLFLLAAAPGSVQAAAPSPSGKIILPEKTEVKLSLEKDLKSGADKVGEVVRYEVERDVFSPFPAHVLLIPAGAEAFGTVTKSSRRGMLGKSGKLEFTCEYVQAPDGTHIPLRSAPTKEKGRNNTGTSVAVAVLFAPVALLMNGRDITVHKGQEFVSYVDEDTALADPKKEVPAPTPSVVPSAPQATGQTLFTLNDGSQFVGTIQSFDGTTYVIATNAGRRDVSAASVKSMQALPNTAQ
jgi:hypothetical protein